MKILERIPVGVTQLTATEYVTLNNIARQLQDNLNQAPYPDRNGISYNVSSKMRTATIERLFTQLDRINQNIGLTLKPYRTYYFTVLNRDIRSTSLDSERYSGNDTFSTRVLVDTDYIFSNGFLYSPDIWTEMRGLSLHLQENARHKVQVIKSDTTLLVLTNKFTWSMFFKLKAIECELYKDRCFTYNTDIVGVYKALATGNIDDFHKYINKILKYKTWNRLNRIKLKSRFTSTKEKKLKSLDARITDQTEIINATERDFIIMLNELERLKHDYELTRMSEDKFDVEEVLDYLDNHRFIKSTSISGESSIRLYIEAPLVYYDIDYVEDYKGYPNNNIKYVMEEVFLKGKYKLWTHASIVLNTSNFYTIAEDMESGEGTYLAHPHLARYGCQGNHTTEIREWLKNYDYIGCIEQIMAMVYNLNWTDGIVMSSMFRTISQDIPDKPIFEVVNTGDFVSFEDILNTKNTEEEE